MRKTLFLRDRPIVGIDISATYLKLMGIDPKKWRVVTYGSVTLDPQRLHHSIDSDPAYLRDMLRELIDKNLVSKLTTHHIVVSIPTKYTYNRNIRVPIEASQKLSDAIRLEAEQYTPVPLSELNLSYDIIETTDSYIDALMSAVPTRIVNNILTACHEADLEVLLAEPSISSVARLITLTEEGHLPTVIVDIGAAATDVAILDKNIRVTASLDLGGNTFTHDVAKALNLPLDKAHQAKTSNGLSIGPQQSRIHTAIEPSLQQIANEIRKTIRYHSERITQDRKIEQVIIVGGGSNIPGLGDFLTNELTMPVRVANPWQVLNFGSLPQPSKQFKPRYITVAGLASIRPPEIWK